MSGAWCGIRFWSLTVLREGVVRHEVCSDICGQLIAVMVMVTTNIH